MFFYDEVTIVSRTSVILADTIVICVTWMKTFRHSQDARRLRMRVNVSMALLTDGKQGS